MSASNAKNGLSDDQGLRFWARQLTELIFKKFCGRSKRPYTIGHSKITRPHHQKVLGELHCVWGVLA